MKSIYQIYESIILEAMSLEEIFKKYYEKEVKDYDRFLEINSIDPTSSKDKRGKYLDWLIRKAFKNSFSFTFFEDKDKIKEDLALFDKNQQKMEKQIGQIKDYKELSKIVREFREKKEKGEIDLSRSEIKKQVEKIFEDSTWLIITPKTEEAAKYYGAHTRWCTASETNNYFDHYNKQGPLYIIIDKKNNKKYQFHFQSEQYMDEEDEPLSNKDLVIIPEYIKKILIGIAKKELKDDATMFFLFIEKMYNNEIVGAESYLKLTKHIDIDEMKNLYMKGYYNSTFNWFIDNNKINEIKYAIENKYVNIKGYGEDDYISGIYSTIYTPTANKEIFSYLINNASFDYIIEKGILQLIAEHNRTDLYKILDKKYDIFKNIDKSSREEFLMTLYSHNRIINNKNDSLLKYLIDSKKISLDYYIDWKKQHLSTYLLIRSFFNNQNKIVEYIMKNTKIYLNELIDSEEYIYSNYIIKDMIITYKDDILNSVNRDKELYNNYKEIIKNNSKI